MPITFDNRGVLIEKLGENGERFQRSTLIFKNGKGVIAIWELGRLKSECYDFAKDPTMKNNQLGPVKPRQPDLSKLNDEEQVAALQEYRDLLALWELEKRALSMQVPIEDMFAIEQYVIPFDDAIHATPSIKGKRFHALTKQVPDEQGGGFLGSFGKKQTASQG